MIAFRHYEGPEHMALQYQLWEELTRGLPYAWKPTLSPRMFEENPSFDPRSRIFAFKGTEPVGYIAFSGSRDFVSFGYPWVKPGFEQLREELYERLYGFASGPEYGGKVFAQRFREQWKEQIGFFEAKGFVAQRRSPIFVAPVKEYDPLTRTNGIEIQMLPSFSFGQYVSLLKEATPDQINMLELYYASVAFDFSIEVKIKGKLGAYLGVTVRKDTGFSEIIAASFAMLDHTFLSDIIQFIFNRLSILGVTNVGIGASLIPEPKALEELGFKHKTADLFVFKNA